MYRTKIKVKTFDNTQFIMFYNFKLYCLILRLGLHKVKI